MAKYYIATTSGSASIDGKEYDFNMGITRVAADHPLVKACPLYFEPIDDGSRAVVPDVEQATAAPGERRGDK